MTMSLSPEHFSQIGDTLSLEDSSRSVWCLFFPRAQPVCAKLASNNKGKFQCQKPFLKKKCYLFSVNTAIEMLQQAK